jgi:hypothetical protein
VSRWRPKTKVKGPSRSRPPAGACPFCHRAAAGEQVTGADALEIRAALRSSLGFERGDLFAFAHCSSGVMVATFNKHLLCRCDLANWDRAVKLYEQLGAEAAWQRLGMSV